MQQWHHQKPFVCAISAWKGDFWLAHFPMGFFVDWEHFSSPKFLKICGALMFLLDVWRVNRVEFMDHFYSSHIWLHLFFAHIPPLILPNLHVPTDFRNPTCLWNGRSNLHGYNKTREYEHVNSQFISIVSEVKWHFIKQTQQFRKHEI